MSTGEEIARARQLAGLTQRELAQKIGVSTNSVSNWERDRSTPRGKEPLLRQVLGMDDDNTTALDLGPTLHGATTAELLAELADRIEAASQVNDERSSLTPPIGTGRYRMKKTEGPTARARRRDDQGRSGHQGTKR